MHTCRVVIVIVAAAAATAGCCCALVVVRVCCTTRKWSRHHMMQGGAIQTHLVMSIVCLMGLHRVRVCACEYVHVRLLLRWVAFDVHAHNNQKNKQTIWFMCLEPKTAMTTTNDNKFAFSIDKFQRFHAIIWLEVNETMSISNQIQTTAEGYRNVEKLARKTQHSDTHRVDVWVWQISMFFFSFYLFRWNICHCLLLVYLLRLFCCCCCCQKNAREAKIHLFPFPKGSFFVRPIIIIE